MSPIFNVKKATAQIRYGLYYWLGAGSLGLAMASGAQAQSETASAEPALPAIYVWGRATEMLGQADSASHGIVGNADFSTRPLMRVGELVEVVPGMIATQHSGSGKANQYFLRGMNLDHGSDFTGLFEGMPVNQRSHAHASGYLDLNFIIPEIIERVEFHKGTYYARNGDFSAAGSSRFKTYDRVERNFLEVTGGNFNHRRLLGVASQDLAEGSMIYAGEVERRDGPWELDEDLKKINLFAKHTGRLFGTDSQISVSAYDASWQSTDQIPLRAVQAGNLSRFGYIDPDLGGQSSRYSLIGNFALEQTDINVYASRYSMNLFANPTYFLEDPVNGDQIEQEDQRWTFGGSLIHRWDTSWAGRQLSPMVGMEVRHDDIGKVNLFNTVARQRSGTIRQDSVQQSSASLFAETEVYWSDSLRTTVGLRGEYFNWDVNANIPDNSGSGSDTILLPKFTSAWTPLEGLELYASYGHGFHSNDVRGAEIRIDPISGEAADPVDVLVRAKGAEAGLRVEPRAGFNFTLAAFWMDLASEMLFAGDAGTSEPNDPTRRHGIETTAFWEVNDWLVLDGMYTWTEPRFRGAPRGANFVPDAHRTTASLGATYIRPDGITASLRLRHFGAAALEETNSARKAGTTLVNLGLNRQFGNLDIGLDLLNLFNSKGNDIEYFFESQLAGEAEPVEDHHFHPVESRAWRLNLRYLF